MSTSILGEVAPGYEPVRDALLAYTELDPTYSAQLAVHRGSDRVVDLTVGDALAPDSLMPVFSCSKGASAIVVAHLIDRGLLDLDERVAAYWPEFAANGKAAITVKALLSHQAGLSGVDGGYTYAELFAHSALAERLAAQFPLWQPGAAHSYHALTIGVLADELVRRVSGETLPAMFTKLVTDARGVDFHLGTPAELDHRFVPIDLPTPEEMAAWTPPAGLFEPGGYSNASAPSDPIPLYMRCNDEDFRRAAVPAAGGTASARGLAAMYAGVANPLAGHDRLVGASALTKASQLQVDGNDLSHGIHFRYATMWQKPTPRHNWGSFRSFGHDGAGGALGYHDPAINISFGYTVKRLPLPGGVDARALALSKVVRDATMLMAL